MNYISQCWAKKISIPPSGTFANKALGTKGILDAWPRQQFTHFWPRRVTKGNSETKEAATCLFSPRSLLFQGLWRKWKQIICLENCPPPCGNSSILRPGHTIHLCAMKSTIKKFKTSIMNTIRNSLFAIALFIYGASTYAQVVEPIRWK